MNQITDTIQNIFSDRPLQEDEYRNEADHLITGCGASGA